MCAYGAFAYGSAWRRWRGTCTTEKVILTSPAAAIKISVMPRFEATRYTDHTFLTPTMFAQQLVGRRENHATLPTKTKRGTAITSTALVLGSCSRSIRGTMIASRS